MHSNSDEQLAIRMQRDDLVASAEFYSRHKGDVFQFCVRLLHNTQDAEDALQSAFLKFLHSVHSLRSPSTVKAWLYAIVRNEVYSSLRKRRSNGSLDEVEVPGAETPHETFVRSEDIEVVQRLMQELKPEYYEVLFLLEYESMSYAEISEAIGVSVAAVEARIFRARKELSQKLLDYTH